MRCRPPGSVPRRPAPPGLVPGHSGTASPRSRPSSELRPSPGSSAPASIALAIGGDPARLAGQLSTAEALLGESGAAPAALARQALIIQLACLRIAAHPGWAKAVTGRIAPAQRAAAAAHIAATADLVALTPAKASPPWRIIPAENLAALRADYRAAQAATRVGWTYLAAINFVESDFGRIISPSSAGARGPMQFLPATWAIYGHGDINRPRNAIFAAARYLAAHGAPASIGSALYAYRPELAICRCGTALRSPAARRPQRPAWLLLQPGDLPRSPRVGPAAAWIRHQPRHPGHSRPAPAHCATAAAPASRPKAAHRIALTSS